MNQEVIVIIYVKREGGRPVIVSAAIEVCVGCAHVVPLNCASNHAYARGEQ